MFERKSRKRDPMVFRPTADQDQKIKSIAQMFKVSVSDVVIELLTSTMTLDSLYSESMQKITGSAINDSNEDC